MSTTQGDRESSESVTGRLGHRPIVYSIHDVNRYASDGRLLRVLREDPVDSLVREAVAGELIRYSVGTLVPRMATGGLLALMRGVGVRQLPTIEQLGRVRAEPDYRQELAHMATADAFVKFETDIRAGRGWTELSRQGLASYFVGGAVFALADLLRAGRRTEHEVARTDSLDEFIDGDGRFSVADVLPVLDVEVTNRVIVSEKVHELADEIDRQLVFYKALKYTEREIAETIGKTPKAVERRWARLKGLHPWIARIG